MATERRFPNADPSLSYDLAKGELTILLGSVDALDNKIAFGASQAITLIAIFLAFVGIRTGQDADIISAWSVGLIVATSVLFLLSILSFGSAFWISTWEIGLAAHDAWDQAERYRDYTQILYWWATESFVQSLTHNRKQYRRKQRVTTVGFGLLTIQFATGIAAIAVTYG